MNTNAPTPRPQAAAVPPSNKQRLSDMLNQAAAVYELSSGNPVLDRLRFQYVLMSYFQESDFTSEGHRRRIGYLELIVSQREESLRAGNAGLDGGQL